MFSLTLEKSYLFFDYSIISGFFSIACLCSSLRAVRDSYHSLFPHTLGNLACALILGKPVRV